MKTFSISAPWDEKSTVVRVELGKYANGRTRINLIDDSDNEPYCTATTNLPDVLLLDNEVFIKDYSENEGVLDFLTTNNIVIATDKWATSGFVDVQVCTLNPESEWGLVPNLYSDEGPEYDSAGFTATSATRPLMILGPIFSKGIFFISDVCKSCSFLDNASFISFAGVGFCCPKTIDEKNKTKKKTVIFIE